MKQAESCLAFGPVPSRRFGRSLGVNNIPYKRCSYSCLYCQLGRTLATRVKRTNFYNPREIFLAVQNHLRSVTARDEKVDFITFVPDGEPTLDRNIGEAIRLVKSKERKLAVITNGSLLWQKDVRDDLRNADCVSIKVDSVSPAVWKRVSRPHPSLELQSILDGIREFSSAYEGVILTETMLLRDINDSPADFFSAASFIAGLHPRASYIAVPTRPPASKWAKPATAYKLAMAHAIFSSNSVNTELLIGSEGDEFASTGDAVTDLLSITSVHPMRRTALETFLRKTHRDWSTVDSLLSTGKILKTEYDGDIFFIRNFNNKISQTEI